jgi:hypothetical protein
MQAAGRHAERGNPVRGPSFCGWRCHSASCRRRHENLPQAHKLILPSPTLIWLPHLPLATDAPVSIIPASFLGWGKVIAHPGRQVVTLVQVHRSLLTECGRYCAVDANGNQQIQQKQATQHKIPLLPSV